MRASPGRSGSSSTIRCSSRTARPSRFAWRRAHVLSGEPSRNSTAASASRPGASGPGSRWHAAAELRRRLQPRVRDPGPEQQSGDLPGGEQGSEPARREPRTMAGAGRSGGWAVPPVPRRRMRSTRPASRRSAVPPVRAAYQPFPGPAARRVRSPAGWPGLAHRARGHRRSRRPGCGMRSGQRKRLPVPPRRRRRGTRTSAAQVRGRTSTGNARLCRLRHRQ